MRKRKGNRFNMENVKSTEKTELLIQSNIIEDLKGTKTEENLHTALSAESQAYLRYLWFASKAKKDGFVEISNVFEEIAGNEKEHAEIWFKYLGGVGSTEVNLDAAANGEHFEWINMYAKFAATARDEGFDSISFLFDRIASIEKEHETRYALLHDSVKAGKTFKSENAEEKWICLNCGYVVSGKEPPLICPACSHPQGYFKKKKAE